jgi:hypothetical protein
MKRILITRINGRFDEQLVEYFTGRNYMVRILADLVNPGCAWLKLPVEIYSCSPFDEKEMANAVKGCDFVVATHCDGNEPLKEKFIKRSVPVNDPAIGDYAHLKTVIYLHEGKVKPASRHKQNACINRTMTFINNSKPASETERVNGEVSSIFVNTVQAVSVSANSRQQSECFESIAERIHQVLLKGADCENYLLKFHNDKETNHWKVMLQNSFETAVDRLYQLMRFPHNLTGF